MMIQQDDSDGDQSHDNDSGITDDNFSDAKYSESGNHNRCSDDDDNCLGSDIDDDRRRRKEREMKKKRRKERKKKGN